MNPDQIAAQLYTCRSILQSVGQVRDTLTRLRDVGYRAVQISGLSWEIIAEDELAALCDELGLVICAAHHPGDQILKDPEGVVRSLEQLGCVYTAFPHPGSVDLSSTESVDVLIRGLDQAGSVLAAAGKVLCYHNHQCEFRKLGDQTILERIYERTAPQHLQGELDTYWVQFGGGDPAGWCRRLAGRCPLLHLKDYVVNAENQVTFTELGAGVLDFSTIIAAAEDFGCRWFIVEQDVCPGDPVESLAVSYRYLCRLCR